MKMYSQRDEEPHIIKYFKDTIGTFLDIGAYEGKTFSNTRQLALQGWGGHCIEPSPSVFPALKARYKDNTIVFCHQIAVSNITGQKLFYDSGGDAISSFDVDHVELWKEKGAKNFSEVMVQSLTVHDLFRLVGTDFDFINIDTEGTSVSILKLLPYDKLTKLKMICVEYDKQLNEVAALLGLKGFTILHRTAENLIGVR